MSKRLRALHLRAIDPVCIAGYYRQSLSHKFTALVTVYYLKQDKYVLNYNPCDW